MILPQSPCSLPWRASCEVTTAERFSSRGRQRSKDLCLIAFSMRIVIPSQPKENRHEASNHFAIAAGWHRRPEHAGSPRRRMRCWRLPGRLRRATWRRRGAAWRCCPPRGRRRAPQGILTLVRCTLVTIVLATILASVASGTNDKFPGRSDIVGARIDYRHQGSTAFFHGSGSASSCGAAWPAKMTSTTDSRRKPTCRTFSMGLLPESTT
jgi:hypothetical protein